MDNKIEPTSLKDFLTVLFKYRKRILIIFFAIVGTVTILSFAIPPTYQAQSSLLVKIGREFMYNPEFGEKSPQMSMGVPNQEEIINSEIKILSNRDSIRKVIAAIGVGKLYPRLANKGSNGVTPVDLAILEFEKDLSVEGIKKSNVIDVSYRHKDPQTAARVTNLLVEFAKEKHLQVYSDPKSSFLEAQLGDYSEKLNNSEDKLQLFKQQREIYALDEQRNLLLKQKLDLDTTYKTSQSRIHELGQKLSILNAQVSRMRGDAQLYTQSERDRIISDGKAKLLELQMKEAELLVKYKPNNKLVTNVRDDIQKVKTFVKEQEDDLKGKVITGNPIYQEVERDRNRTESDLKGERAKSEILKAQILQTDNNIKDLDFSEKEFQNLKREAVTNEKNYKNYLDKFQEARIADDMNRKKMANISIMQAATVPVKPIKPRKGLNILLSIFLGAAAGLGYAFVSEYSSQGLSTPESVEKRTGLRVLAAVPVKR